LGTVLDPHAAWLLLRGIRTLGLRVLRQADSALAIAEFLRSSAEVSSVVYPYLSGTPQWPVAERQMRGGGGVLCFVPQGGIPAAHAFVNALEMIPIASSLGGVETIVEMPGDLDWSEDELGGELTEAEIPPGLVRLSVGVEDLSDILRDLQRGLDAIAVNSRDGSAVTREGEGPS
ncbi:MAG: PLP-dependent transferase, partial [Steroidobacteraceae bacterium]